MRESANGISQHACGALCFKGCRPRNRKVEAMRTFAALLVGWMVFLGVFVGLTRNERELIEFRDTVIARLGFSIPSDTLDIHTGKADCWYE